MYTVYHYPTCSTCKKAIKWLKDHDIAYELKHMIEETPSSKLLQSYINASGLPFKKFFNTSGKVYRENNIKDQLADLSVETAADLLAGNGMLIKRPILTDGKLVLVGFKEAEWTEHLL